MIPPIAIGMKTKGSKLLKPCSIGVYKPRIINKFDGLNPGTKTPKAIKAPAMMKPKKLAGMVPKISLMKNKNNPPPINIEKNQIISILSRLVREVDSLIKVGNVPIIVPAKPQRTII